MSHVGVVLGASAELTPARMQMAFTLGSHIILACLGVAWPFVIMVAHLKGRRGDDAALLLAQRWSKVLAVTFAVGAVSGTVLSFEMGLLWPAFMGRFGDVFGIPFAVEGLFFFTEAIFLAIYIYGWKRMPPRLHFWTIVPVVVAGLGGAFSVVTANAWMNQPQGFALDAGGNVTEIDTWKVLFNGATAHEVAHMTLAAYIVTGFLVASVYAVGMLRGRRDRYHRLGFLVPFTVAAVAMPFQMFVGDFAARQVFNDQPEKFAAMELVPETSTDVPETIGGFYIDGEVRYGIPIPGLASLLSDFSTSTEIQGFETVPEDDRPPVNVVHWAWDIMIGLGTALFLLAVWFGFVWWRRRDLPKTNWFLRVAAVAGVAAIVTLEAGWTLTETGRQPWIVVDYMRVEDAVTGASGVWFTFTGVVLLYAAMAIALAWVLRTMARRWREGEEVEVPYGPTSPDEEATTVGAGV